MFAFFTYIYTIWIFLYFTRFALPDGHVNIGQSKVSLAVLSTHLNDDAKKTSRNHTHDTLFTFNRTPSWKMDIHVTHIDRSHLIYFLHYCIKTFTHGTYMYTL